MQYQKSMEIIQSDLMEKVLQSVEKYDYNLYTS